MLINIEHGKYGTECLVTFKSTSPKIEGVVAIHNTKLGPAMGGCRIYEELDFESATLDAIKLAKTMSYKNAICNLPYGGGKAVIVKHKSSMTEVMTFFAKVMNLLNGTYLTTEDVGTNDKDMDFLRNYTRYALGEPIKGMPMSSAAYGVYVAIKASLFGLEGKQDLNGLKVAVQGLGKVGFKLCEFLHKEGCRLYVCDIKKDLETQAYRMFNAESFSMENIENLSLDIFSPCALGESITIDNYFKFNTKYIIGGANNPLSDEVISDLLYAKRIIYIPDFLSNAGGVLEVNFENDVSNYKEPKVFANIQDVIYNKTISLLQKSMELRLPPLKVAQDMIHNDLGIDATAS